MNHEFEKSSKRKKSSTTISLPSSPTDLQSTIKEILRTETFVKEIHEKLLSSEFITNLCRSIVESDVFIQTITTLVDNKLNVYETKLSVLEEENKQLKSHIHSIQVNVNDMDQYSKRKDVIITGIPQTPEEDTTKLVIN
ncbi:unnamed protein product [Didymodactylos carnosus]|uniref:Uncharacterized protein n=1 Tax=Didymodactylos carnosus TaxID=1234261 RepID=A0A815SFE4_9BILA|nr:unnamed protein product [Didymodactylos carnosus]CAF1489421.1 unnamed protein product [Didymodactylos carnosus]CAF3982738.1 unnamed protein product [Didymodactylos carnosus]CAF4352733.1 unnamed protein product [Didymodactylos carnosus]